MRKILILVLCATSFWGCQSRASFSRDLTSDDPVLRTASLEKLERMKPEKQTVLVSHLVRKLRDPNSLIANRAADAIGVIGAPAIEKLQLAAADKDPFVASMAIEIIGKIGPGPQETIPILINASRHTHPLVREEAVSALGKIDSPQQEVIEALKIALTDQEKWVRDEAKAALDAVKSKKHI